MRSTGIGIGAGYPGGALAPAFSDGHSVAFGGAYESITMGNVLGAQLESDQTWSISLWVKMPPTYPTYVLISKFQYTFFRHGLILVSGGGSLTLEISTNSGNARLTKYYGGTLPRDNTWKHVCATYTGSRTLAGMSLYVNGIYSDGGGDAVGSVVSIATTRALYLGSADSSDYFVGNMDEVSIYSKTLSPAEVQWIYNAGHPNNLLDPAAPSNLLSWLRMGDGDTYPTILDHGPAAHNGTMIDMEAGDIVADTP